MRVSCERWGKTERKGFLKFLVFLPTHTHSREGKGKEGKGREGKGREGKGPSDSYKWAYVLEASLLSQAQFHVAKQTNSQHVISVHATL